MTSAYDRLNRQLPGAANNTPVEHFGAAQQAIDRLAAHFAAETSPSRHEHVTGTLGRLRHASIVLGAALVRAHEVIANIVALGELIGTNPVRRTGTVGTGISGASTFPTAVSPRQSHRDALVPRAVTRAARALPRRVREHDKTEGFLLAGDQILCDPAFAADSEGRLCSRQIRIGRAPAAGVGLRRPMAQAFIMDHVEAQAAAVLRQPDAPSTASLVLNQAPCKDPDAPLVCERALRHIIPNGTVLMVYITDGNRTWHHATYHGTGREIGP